MLGLVQSWFKPGANPIGIDFGSEGLRLAQVERVNGEFRLVAAAHAEVPADVRRGDAAARMEFFTATVRTLWSQGNFRGRRAVLALPAAAMHVQHLRIAKMDDDELKKALPWEAAGKLPIDPSQALLRHLVAGEVYQENDPKLEVILMAARREWVTQLLAAAARARLDIVGMNVEPKATIDCFSHVYRRKSDAEAVQCFLDIGAAGTRAFVVKGGHVFFARNLPVGGDHFDQAVAEAMDCSIDEARTLRRESADEEPTEMIAPPRTAERAPEESFALLSAGLAASHRESSTATLEAPVAATRKLTVTEACEKPLAKLITELDLCRRYYESTFPGRPIDRLLFVGGGARSRGLCVQIARELHLAAQVGDPLVRMGRTTEIDPRSGIDRREPQPAWAVALGLSMGPPNVEPAK